MIKINIVAVGKIKDDYYTKAIVEYSKRLSRFASFNIIETAESKCDFDIISEGKDIIKRLLNGYNILLDIEGDLISSVDLANIINTKTANGVSHINFIIGGSRGVSESVKDVANLSISLGKITLPHQLARVVLTEQIYRAFTVLNNINYHK